jgi:TolA-binding protein
MSKFFKAMNNIKTEKEPVRMTGVSGRNFGSGIIGFIKHMVPIALAVGIALWIFSIPVVRISKQVTKQTADLKQIKHTLEVNKTTVDTSVALMEKAIEEIKSYTAADSDQLNARLRKLAGDIYLIDQKFVEESQKNGRLAFDQEKELEELKLNQKLMQDTIDSLKNEINQLRKTAAAAVAKPEHTIDVTVDTEIP